MGLFSSKSSSRTSNYDNRGAADDGSLVATGSSHINSSTTTNNIEQSEDALRLAQNTITDAFDALAASNKRADEIAREALGQAQGANERAATSDLKEITEKMADRVVPLALIVGGFVLWRAFSK